MCVPWDNHSLPTVLHWLPCLFRLALTRPELALISQWPFSWCHVSCASDYPFQWMQYCFSFLRPKKHILMIASISHLGCPSTMFGGSSKKFGPCSRVSLYGDKYEAWNTLWIFQVPGNFNWYATWLRTFNTKNGPYLFAHSLCVGCVVLRSFTSSHTCSPSFYGWKLESLIRSIWLCRIAS